MTPEQAILSAYRPHDRHTENRLVGPGGLTAMEISQAFYGVKGGREFLVNFLAEHARPGDRADSERQTWEFRRIGTDLALHFEVDSEGRVRIHEAVLARVLHEAGWERRRGGGGSCGEDLDHGVDLTPMLAWHGTDCGCTRCAADRIPGRYA